MAPFTPGMQGDLQPVITALQAITIKIGDLIQQLNASFPPGGSPYVLMAGGTMTADPTVALGVATKQYVDNSVAAHYVRVHTANNALNATVANGAVLRFDTVDTDTNGFAPGTTPFSVITIPAGYSGAYVINGWSSGSGSQATTLGMGIMINGGALAGTNQSITGPSSVNYTLDNAAVSVLRLNAGDTVQLVNTSVSGGTNAFTAVFLSLAWLGG